MIRNVVFEETDLALAVDALDTRYLARPDATEAAAARWVFDLLAAYNARDWARYHALHLDDAIVTDHRPTGWGTARDLAEVTANLRAMIDLIPDMNGVCAAIIETGPDAILSTSCFSGTSPEGTAVEFAMHVVTLLRDGRAEHMEMFPEDSLADARHRFAVLARSTPSIPENRCTRAQWEIEAKYGRDDWRGVAAIIGDDMLYEDRRRGLASSSHGRDAYVEMLRYIHNVRTAAVETTVLATRGQRLALVRTVLSGPQEIAYEVEVFSVKEVDEDGCLVAQVVFDLGELGDAYRVLDARYLRGEAAPYAETWRIVSEWLDAVRDHRWVDASAAAPRVELVDHRLASFGTLRRHDVRTLAEAYADVSPDTIGGVAAAIEEISARGAVIMLWHGSAAARAHEGPIWATVGVADSKVTFVDLFPEDALDAALRRFRAI
jgi:hypothetical protein